MEVALAFVVSTAEVHSKTNGGETGDNGYDAEAVQELLEWRKRLGEETKQLDPGSAVDGKSGGCLARWFFCGIAEGPTFLNPHEHHIATRSKSRHRHSKHAYLQQVISRILKQDVLRNHGPALNCRQHKQNSTCREALLFIHGRAREKGDKKSLEYFPHERECSPTP